MLAMAKILVLHGPNLNLLGKREPGYYSSTPLETINKNLLAHGQKLGYELDIFQSNSEAELIEQIQKAPQHNIHFIIINPAAFTHTSIALRDALLAVSIPFIEVHLSNVQARETFRHHSYFSDIALGVITGLGPIGYDLALQAAHHHLQTLLGLRKK